MKTQFKVDQPQAVQTLFERHPFLSQLFHDYCIYGTGGGLLGPDLILDVTEGDAQWHGVNQR